MPDCASDADDAARRVARDWRLARRDFPEDYDLVLRLLAAGAEAAKVPEALYFWRDWPARASRVDPRYRPEAFAALKARFLADGPLRGRPEIVVWGAGRSAAACCNRCWRSAIR